MTLTPMDIHNKEFATKLRGYDSKQVDSFLDRIVDAYGDALDQIVDLKNENVELKKSVDKYDKVKDSINESLISAQENAEEIKKKTNIEAQEIIKKLIKTRMIFLKRLKMMGIKREPNFRASMIL
jgi:cell division initiation protein